MLVFHLSYIIFAVFCRLYCASVSLCARDDERHLTCRVLTSVELAKLLKKFNAGESRELISLFNEEEQGRFLQKIQQVRSLKVYFRLQYRPFHQILKIIFENCNTIESTQYQEYLNWLTSCKQLSLFSATRV